jgi:hypothetical protein
MKRQRNVSIVDRIETAAVNTYRFRSNVLTRIKPNSDALVSPAIQHVARIDFFKCVSHLSYH